MFSEEADATCDKDLHPQWPVVSCFEGVKCLAYTSKNPSLFCWGTWSDFTRLLRIVDVMECCSSALVLLYYGCSFELAWGPFPGIFSVQAWLKKVLALVMLRDNGAVMCWSFFYICGCIPKDLACGEVIVFGTARWKKPPLFPPPLFLDPLQNELLIISIGRTHRVFVGNQLNQLGWLATSLRSSLKPVAWL